MKVTQQGVLQVMRDHAGQMSHREIARWLKVSPSRVSIVLSVLRMKGLALCLRPGVTGPGGAPSVWVLAGGGGKV